MSSNQIPKPTESELEILHVLWANGPSSVRFVNDKINESKKGEVGYTTTLKIMQIMFADKKLLLRNTDSRTHIYEANVTEKETQNALLQKFVDRTFKGSAMQLVMQALGNHQTTSEELEQIKALIESIENKK
ncbi:MAG: BlaI/MecI/CopY family transcriptional regulator [Saprospiraceae bacterium]